MNNRDVSISICGVVAGIMLAAATVSPVSANLTGDLTRPSIRPTEALRNLRKDRLGTSVYKRIQAAPAHATAGEPEVDCEIAKEIHSEVSTAVTVALPFTAEEMTSTNAKAAASIKSTLDAIYTKYCGSTDVEPEMTMEDVDNNCEKFVVPSRRAACLSAEDLGRVYP